MTTQEERTSSPPAHEAARRLEKWFNKFDFWAATMDRSEYGWESWFPEWKEMNREAEQVMAAETQDSHTMFLVARFWAITEEYENCADWAQEHLRQSHVRATARGEHRAEHPLASVRRFRRHLPP